MTLNEYLVNSDEFTEAAKQSKVAKALRFIADEVESGNISPDRWFITDCLQRAVEIEHDDGFGTEGMDL